MADNQSMNPDPMKKAEDGEPHEAQAMCAGCEKATTMALCPSCAAERSGLSKISPQNGDVILLKSKAPPPQQMVHQMAQILKAMGIQCSLFVIPDTMDISAMPEDAMRKSGWVRAPYGIILPGSTPLPKSLKL